MGTRLAGVAAVWAGVVLAAGGAAGQPPKDPDLGKRVADLEKRVAELEKALKGGPPARYDPTGPTAAKLVGVWEAPDEEREMTVFLNLVLKDKGECEFVRRGRPTLYKGSYKLVGKSFLFTTPESSVPNMQFRVVSVDEKELVLELVFEDQSKPVRYRWTREK